MPAGGVEAHLALFWPLLAFGVVPSFALNAGPGGGPGAFDVVPLNFTSVSPVSALPATTICGGLVLVIGGALQNVGGVKALGAMLESSVQRQGRATQAGEMSDHTRLKDSDVRDKRDRKDQTATRSTSEAAPAGQEHVEQSQHMDA